MNYRRQIKETIKYALSESSGKIHLYELDMVFKQLTGDFIPFKKFHYETLEDFMMSLNDICEIIPEGRCTYIRRAKGHTQAPIEPSSNVVDNVPVRFSLNIRRSTVTNCENKQNNYIENTNENIESHKEKSQTKPQEDNKQANGSIEETQTTNDKNENQILQCKEHIDVATSNIIQNESEQTEVPKTNGVEGNSDELQINSTPTETPVLDIVKERFKILITKHPEGIWCRDLPFLYKEKFRVPLRISGNSMSAYCARCSDIFRLFRPGVCDWLLLDATQPVPSYLQDMLVLMTDVRLQNRHILLQYYDSVKNKGEWERFVDNVEKVNSKISQKDFCYEYNADIEQLNKLLCALLDKLSTETS